MFQNVIWLYTQGQNSVTPLRMRTVGEDEGMAGMAEDLGFMPADEGSRSWSSFKLGVQSLHAARRQNERLGRTCSHGRR